MPSNALLFALSDGLYALKEVADMIAAALVRVSLCFPVALCVRLCASLVCMHGLMCVSRSYSVSCYAFCPLLSFTRVAEAGGGGGGCACGRGCDARWHSGYAIQPIQSMYHLAVLICCLFSFAAASKKQPQEVVVDVNDILDNCTR